MNRSVFSRGCRRLCSVVNSVNSPHNLIKQFKHTDVKVGMLGLCEDRNSSFLTGAADAPGHIRNALNCSSSNSWVSVFVYHYI